ncbi:MAG TPA: O-methyltransferase [Terriglobales bacterium]|nr:O-methyltransferase [Terriglobales bacterium]
MAEITYPAVERYLYSSLPLRDEVLRKIEAEAQARKIPIVGPAVGRVLHQLALTLKARSVFEMGSAVGYSTIWWARAVGAGGRVIYTDGDRKNAAEAQRYFEQAGVADRIDVCVGDALEILSEQKPGSFDIVFNDVDKEDYLRVLKLAVARVRTGGLLITDNVLWRGEVADPEKSSDKRAQIIAEYNRQLYSSRELFTTILPLRDGVAVSLKL